MHAVLSPPRPAATLTTDAHATKLERPPWHWCALQATPSSISSAPVSDDLMGIGVARQSLGGVVLLWLCSTSAGQGKKPNVPVTEVDFGEMEWGAVKCAACDYLVEHLDSQVSAALIENKVIASVRRNKKVKKKQKMKGIKDVPWLQSELGWGQAVEDACEYKNLKDLAYLVKDGQYKLMPTSDMTPEMAEMAKEQVLGRDRSAYQQFQTACQDIADDNDRAVVRVIRDAPRKKMKVGANTAADVTEAMIPTMPGEKDGLKHTFCVETARVCDSERYPRGAPTAKANQGTGGG
eukprot:COSAG02_NODE_12212_length_1580_cov_1.159352_1_plen_293_part_00